MRILLISAYHAASHQYWCEGLMTAMAEYQWTLLTLPPRHFAWRIRGSALTLATEYTKVVTAPYDLIVCTSMCDIAALRGLVPSLATTPCLVYFHENQFAYPDSERETSRVEAQMVTLYGALAADAVVFNSEYNQRTFIAGVVQLAKKLPDGISPNLGAVLLQKSRVLPVPVTPKPLQAPDRSETSRRRNDRFQLVWNHRWEYDKGPEILLAVLQQLPTALPLTVHVLGQSFRKVPTEFNDIYALLTARGWLGQWGFVLDRDAYWAILSEAQVVLSTAHHDFQGLSVIEAAMAGARPLVPDALAYPEWFDSSCRYRFDCAPERHAAEAILTFVQQWQSGQLKGVTPLPLTWTEWQAPYRALLEAGRA